MGFLEKINIGGMIKKHVPHYEGIKNTNGWFVTRTIELNFGEYVGRPSKHIDVQTHYLTYLLERGWKIVSVLKNDEGGTWESYEQVQAEASRMASTAQATDNSSSTKTGATGTTNTNTSAVENGLTTSKGTSDSKSESKNNSSTESSQTSETNNNSQTVNQKTGYTNTSTTQSSSSHNSDSSSSNNSGSSSTTIDNSTDTTTTTGSNDSTQKSKSVTKGDTSSSTYGTTSNVANSDKSSTSNTNTGTTNLSETSADGVTNTASNTNEASTDVKSSTQSGVAFWYAFARIRLQREALSPKMMLATMMTSMVGDINSGRANVFDRYNEMVTIYAAMLAHTEDELNNIVSDSASFKDLSEKIWSDMSESVDAFSKLAFSIPENWGDSRKYEINLQYDNLTAQTRVQMVENGTYNGTVWTTVISGVEKKRSEALNALEDEKNKLKLTAAQNALQLKANVYNTMSQMRISFVEAEQKHKLTPVETRNAVLTAMLNFMERHEDEMPNISEMYNIAERYGSMEGAVNS